MFLQIIGNPHINKQLAIDYQLKIYHSLNAKAKELKTRQPTGIVFIITMPDAVGAKQDHTQVSQTFDDHFKFATHHIESPTITELASFIHGASTLVYPVTCHYRIFYFAGHGGLDGNQQPFFVTVNKELSIQQDVLAEFDSIKPADSFIFIFDCCLSSVKEYDASQKPLSLHTPHRCLVAFGTSPDEVASGKKGIGGYYSNALCEHLKKLEEGGTLSHVLSLTHDAVRAAYEQKPFFQSCTGPLYLKGMLQCH